MNKILVVGQWFVSENEGKVIIPGGTERYIYGLAKQLQEDGYEVTVLSATTNKYEAGFNFIDGLNVFKFKVPEKKYGYVVDLFSLWYTLKIIKMCAPDIVHIVSARYRFATGAVAAATITNTRTVYTRTTFPYKENRKWVPAIFDDYISIKIIEHADVMISLSEEIMHVLEQEINHKQIKIIPSFIMHSYYVEVERDENTLLFVGRLDRLKGIESLIEAVSLVKIEIPEVRLSIVGLGDLLPRLKKLVSNYNLENNVTFEGHLCDDALVDMYSKSGIFVFPSFSEGMPIALLEAMSGGLPVLTYDIRSCAEALGGGKFGIMVKKGDVKSLANKIIELLKNEEMRDFYSNMSLERSKDYSQEIIVQRIEDVYSSLIRGDM